MKVFDAVRTLLAVRQYQDRPAPADVVRKVAEAAWLTGSSRNGQPWHFIVVQEREALQKLGAVATTGPYTANAAFAVVVAVDTESPYGLSDASRAIQSMMLTAWEEGVASNWVGFNNLGGVNQLFGIPPNVTVVAVVPFGYPTARIGKGKKNRKPFGEIVNSERFGQPFQ